VRQFLATLAAAPLLFGCVSTPAEDDLCNSMAAQEYVGTVATDEVRAALSQIAPERIRYINPGDAVTADYRPGRMNVAMDESGTISSIYCV